MKISLYILFFTLSSFSCHSQENLKDYYYQFGKEKETKIYQYINTNDPLDIAYWKVITNPITKEIITYGIDEDFELRNVFKEKIVSRGSILFEFTVFDKNFFGFQKEKKTTVLKKKVYSWNKDEVCIQSYKFKDSEFGEIEIQKTREFEKIESLSLGGKMYEVAKFIDVHKTSLLRENDFQEELTYSYYAKGFGMIKYRNYGIEEVREMEFKRLFTQEEFDAYKKRKK